jgi:hypothetical protein
MHHETDRHETPVSSWVAVDDGLSRTTEKEVPFHCSMSADSPPANWATPTATQNEVVTQETPVSAVFVAVGTVGSVSNGDHVVPFHVCASYPGPAMIGPPTFMQNVEVTQETCPGKMVEVVVTAFGTADQLEALTCAGTVRPCGWAAGAPPASTRSSGSAISATAHPAVNIRTADRIAASPSLRPSGRCCAASYCYDDVARA